MSDQSSDASSRPETSPDSGDVAESASGTGAGPGSEAAPGSSGPAEAVGKPARASTLPVPPQKAGPGVPQVPSYLRTAPPRTDVWQRRGPQP